MLLMRTAKEDLGNYFMTIATSNKPVSSYSLMIMMSMLTYEEIV